MLSIIIPVYNEEKVLVKTLPGLRRSLSLPYEIIGVDGGSDDRSLNILKAHCDVAVVSVKGRAQQMNAGAALASGSYLLFLHADTQLPVNISVQLSQVFNKTDWGHFNVYIDHGHPLYRVIALAMNLRSHYTRVATGDQCLFFERNFFNDIGGFPNIALMEDIAISKQARASGNHVTLPGPVITSARRWEANGRFRTIFTMWWLRLCYSLGVSPSVLAKRYYG